MMDRKYFELAIRLNESAMYAVYIAKNINYKPTLNKPDDDNLEGLLSEAQDIANRLKRVISNQLKDSDE